MLENVNNSFPGIKCSAAWTENVSVLVGGRHAAFDSEVFYAGCQIFVFDRIFVLGQNTKNIFRWITNCNNP